MNAPAIIPEREFEETWGAHAHISGELFTYDQVKNQDCRYVWTIIDDGGATNHWYAQPGYHTVNVLGYVLTTKPWETGLEEAYWFEDDLDEDGSEEP